MHTKSICLNVCYNGRLPFDTHTMPPHPLDFVNLNPTVDATGMQTLEVVMQCPTFQVPSTIGTFRLSLPKTLVWGYELAKSFLV